MDLTFCLAFLSFCATVTESFFFLAEKHEPIWFCFKICPLYCGHRRHDIGAPPIYWDEDYGSIIHEEPERFVPYHYFCKPPEPKPTTTPAPTTTMTTTTEEPTYICMVCMKKCGNLMNK